MMTFVGLLMTPRAPPAASSASSSAQKSASTANQEKKEDKQKKKKIYHPAKPKKEAEAEDEEENPEWAANYRDRARERREGKNADYGTSDDILPSTSGYRAVAPDNDPNIMAEMRKQVIQESKFLGGDMEHTHLVKGLDYALLQKVRSELEALEDMEKDKKVLEKKKEKEKEKAAEAQDITFKTTLAKNVHRTLFQIKPPQKNEFFQPGRMAYVFELDDEYTESDIPTTLIRSKADCPNMESQTTLTTNDIVINKLTQILSYLRQGARAPAKKGKKKDKGSDKPLAEEVHVPVRKPQPLGESIFPDAGDYSFDTKTSIAPQVAQKPSNYFDTSGKEIEVSQEEIRRTTEEFLKAVHNKYSEKDLGGAGGEGGGEEQGASDPKKNPPPPSDKLGKAPGFGGFSQEHYAECYPGLAETADALYDSDEDVDYTKMDMGNKKGPVRRWDFDTEEEYGKYQSNREALPKAAFQYGVKMSEGRKTRRFTGGQNDKAKEKAKLNRQWQQINQLMQKRKGGGGGGGGDDESAVKKARQE
eukprot:Em0022g172a